MDEIKAEYAGLKSPEGPPRRRFITSDTTIEKASELMKDNPRGLTILRDELVGLACCLGPRRIAKMTAVFIFRDGTATAATPPTGSGVARSTRPSFAK